MVLFSVGVGIGIIIIIVLTALSMADEPNPPHSIPRALRDALANLDWVEAQIPLSLVDEKSRLITDALICIERLIEIYEYEK
jgi:hypothetical protein